jgi:hypothetical protein
LALALSLGAAVSVSCAVSQDLAGMVYTMTNSAVRGNAIVACGRQEDGSLELVDVFPTGGLGSGPAPTSTVFGSPVPATADGLGSQGSLILSADRRFLFAVNAAAIPSPVCSSARPTGGHALRTPAGSSPSA